MLTWQDCVATAECRLSLDCENVCNVVEVINLFYFIFDEGPNDDWTKELFSISILQQFVAKSIELCKQSQEKLLQLMVVSWVNETWKHGIIYSRSEVNNNSYFCVPHLISVIPEQIVWLLPGVPDDTGEVESAASLHMNLPTSHYLCSRHWNWEE